MTEAIRVRTRQPTQLRATSALPVTPAAPMGDAMAAGGGVAGALTQQSDAAPPQGAVLAPPPASAPAPPTAAPGAGHQQLTGPGSSVPDSESDWDAARLGHGPYGDPRIGRPKRSGTLLALLALFATLTAAAPLLALLVLFGWATLARTADRWSRPSSCAATSVAPGGATSRWRSRPAPGTSSSGRWAPR